MISTDRGIALTPKYTYRLFSLNETPYITISNQSGIFPNGTKYLRISNYSSINLSAISAELITHKPPGKVIIPSLTIEDDTIFLDAYFDEIVLFSNSTQIYRGGYYSFQEPQGNSVLFFVINFFGTLFLFIVADHLELAGALFALLIFLVLLSFFLKRRVQEKIQTKGVKNRNPYRKKGCEQPR